MKVGVRKRSFKGTLKAKTTGKAKRAVKRKISPGYGKKGIGLIKNPKKAIYNRVYNKTTVRVPHIITTTKSNTSVFKKNQYTNNQISRDVAKTKLVAVILAILFGLFTWLYTYRRDGWKFWLNFLLVLFTLGYWAGISWFWAIIDVCLKPSSWYKNYQRE